MGGMADNKLLNPMAMFSKKQKVAKAPEVPAPAALPDETGQAGDTEAKNVRKQMGYEKQILAGALAPKSTGKKTRLGG
jgi:hypothetical protein